MLDRLGNNIGLKLLSLGVALALWAYLRLTPNPVIAARFEQQVSVPITTTGLATDEIAHLTDHQAVVAIAVPPAGAPIKPDDVRAVLDLAARGPGVYNVPVEIIAPKYDIKSLSPATVTLSIERIETRTLPLSIHYTNDRRNLVVGPVSLTPSAASVRGPASLLVRVASLRVDVPLTNEPARLDAMLRPAASDERGNEVSGLTVSPNLVRVRARFSASSGSRP